MFWVNLNNCACKQMAATRLRTYYAQCYNHTHTTSTGDLVFWVKLNKGACKQMAATRSEAVNASWSPCGRYVLTSTVAPRLRVDNNIRVFTYYGAWRCVALCMFLCNTLGTGALCRCPLTPTRGEMVAERMLNVLLEAHWLLPPPRFASPSPNTKTSGPSCRREGG